MQKVITSEKIPIKLWLDDIEEGALDQAKNIANLLFAFKHVALMPDCHQGYGFPIGGVLATKGVVVPNAVGVDIGCGMSAAKTNLTDISKEDLKKIMGKIRERIPLGMNHHKEKQDSQLMPDLIVNSKRNEKFNVISSEYMSALHQLGTLGSGNHFLECQRDTDGFVWVMIHSGSRNLGKKVADYYNKIAVRLNNLWFSQVDTKKQLAFLPIETQEAKDYLLEMNYCVEFAFANRKLMMQRVIECINEVLPDSTYVAFNGQMITNIAHNYARFENHFNTNVLVHRKGATSARAGEIGIIPSSQGSKSYIVEGLGNADSFTSCSHGAGRKMGRGAAVRELNLEDEIRKMDEQGIVHGMRNQSDLDEAAGAYKDIDTVMRNQSDLVKILVELTPLAVIKG